MISTNFQFGKLKQIKQIFLKTMNNSELNKNKNKSDKQKKLKKVKKVMRKKTKVDQKISIYI